MADDHEQRKARTRRNFNRAAESYDSGPGCFAHFGRRLAAASDIRPGHAVLDVASGRGAVLFPAAELAGPTGAVTGIDLSEAMARATNAEAERREISARVRVLDAEILDFADASFDRVLCGFGVMFFPDPPRALGEFRRVLKGDGRIGVSTWHRTQNHELGAVLSEQGIGVNRQSGWISEAGELSELLARAGFRDVAVATDAHDFRYTGADEYWQQAWGTGLRDRLEALDAGQQARVRDALAARLEVDRRADGVYSEAVALIATAARG